MPDLEYALDKEIEEFHAALAACEPSSTSRATSSRGSLSGLSWSSKQHHVGKSWVRPITRNGQLRSSAGRCHRLGRARGHGPDHLRGGANSIEARRRRGRASQRVAGNACGGPEDRVRRILRDLLHRVEDVLRYLALLLRDPGIDDVASALWRRRSNRTARATVVTEVARRSRDAGASRSGLRP